MTEILTEPATPAPSEDGRRGRPRPQTTLERDAAVIEMLAQGAKTTAELAEGLRARGDQAATPGLAYLCIYRIKRTADAPPLARARVDGKTVWSIDQV